jgi:hypothetical protein
MSPVSSRTIMMSSPLTTSGFSVDASTSSGKTTAGRRFEKKSHSLRRLRIAFSGRLSRASLSCFGTPDRAEEDRVGFLRELERLRGQRIAVRVVGDTAHERFLGFDLQPFAPQHIEDANGFSHDFGADAIARKEGDLHWKIQGSVFLRFSS